MISTVRATLVAGVGVLAGLSAVLAACSSSTREGAADDTSNTQDSGPNIEDPGFGSGPTDAATTNGCKEEAKLVYVLSLEGDLYSFAPADKKFKKVGALDCQLDGEEWQPVSMAVDRDAVAWVNMRSFSADMLFKVDTTTAECTPSKIQGQPGTMGGMGFSSNDDNAEEETLYVIGPGSSGLGTPALNRVDFAKNKLVPVAEFDEFSDLELTGTGDGRLYGFFVGTNPMSLKQANKKTAALSGSVDLDGVLKPLAPMFAFSFWGGDFYFYTASSTSPSKTTTVARYLPSTGKIEEAYMDQIGFHIVGAGVSTCAPTTSPR